MKNEKFFCLICVATVSLTLSVSDVSAQTVFDLSILNNAHIHTDVSVLQDYDDDGDLDIIINTRGPATVEWLENDGTGQFPRRLLYADETLVRVKDIDPCDCDNDGDIDYVISGGTQSLTEGQLFWIQRQEDGSFIKWTIEAGADFDEADVADLNNDGTQDVVGVGFNQSTVNIYLNDGNLNFTKEVVADSVIQVDIVDTDDIDGDGDVDIVYGGGTNARLLRNQGQANFDEGQELFSFNNLTSSSSFGVRIVDLNNDGVKDILTYPGIGFTYLTLLDGANDFSRSRIEVSGSGLPGDLSVGDFDGNGLLDIIRQDRSNSLLSILYQEEPMQFRQETLELNWNTENGGAQMAVGDLDDDGDLDLIFPENRVIDADLSWFENIDGTLYRHQLHMQLVGARIPKMVDFDDDGDLDIFLSVTEKVIGDNEIMYFENQGNATFINWIVSDSLDHPADLEVADIDGDGNLDLVATARDDNDLVWFRRDGLDWQKSVIEENANLPLGATVVDLDQDGDNDIVLASSGDAKVFWYLNDGSGTFSRRVVDPNLPDPREVEASDLDGDGDIDLAVATVNEDNSVVVFVNDGDENFTREIISTGYHAFDIEIGDWTNDGHSDIIIASNEVQFDSQDVILLANDGTGTFIESPLATEMDNASALRLVDIDRDEDLDLIIGSDRPSFEPSLRLAINEEGSILEPVVDLLEGVEGEFFGVDAGDIDNNGFIDIVAADFRFDNLVLLLGQEDNNTQTSNEEAEQGIPATFSLEQNFPNPFRGTTTINFDLPTASYVKIEIFDVHGRLVDTLVSGEYVAGRHQITWTSTGQSSGSYFYRLNTEAYSEVKMLLLIK